MDLIVQGEVQQERDAISFRTDKREQAVAKAASCPSQRAESPAAVAAVQPVAAPAAPFLGTRVVQDLDCRSIWPYLNRKALTRGQWQMKRGSRSEAEHDAWLRETCRSSDRSTFVAMS